MANMTAFDIWSVALFLIFVFAVGTQYVSDTLRLWKKNKRCHSNHTEPVEITDKKVKGE